MRAAARCALMAALAAMSCAMAVSVGTAAGWAAQRASDADGSAGALIAAARGELSRSAGEADPGARSREHLGLAADDPWCAAFVSLCAAEAGCTQGAGGAGGGLIPQTASVQAFLSYYRENPGKGAVLPAAESAPAAGDLAVWSPGVPDAGQAWEHMGIVIRVEADGTAITIEGNANAIGGIGRVAVNAYPNPAEQISYLIRPAWAAASDGEGTQAQASGGLSGLASCSSAIGLGQEALWDAAAGAGARGQDYAAASPRQRAAADLARRCGALGTLGGYCEAWVEEVYRRLGCEVDYRMSAADAAAAYATGTGDIPVGAAVYGPASSAYGHVGIYLGDGEVVSREADAVRVRSLADWVGVFGYSGWGWPGGNDLSAQEGGER